MRPTTVDSESLAVNPIFVPLIFIVALAAITGFVTLPVTEGIALCHPVLPTSCHVLLYAL